MAQTVIPRQDVRVLAQRSDAWGAWLTLHCWGVIVAAMTVYVLLPNPLTAILAGLVIGSRQHGLAILMHEAAHGALFKSRKINDFVGTWLTGAPVGESMVDYRRYHLTHHKHTQTERDPDLHLSAKFPTSRASMIRKFARDAAGLTGLKLRLGAIREVVAGRLPARRVVPFLVFNAAMFAVFWAAGHALAWGLLWLLPLLTWFQVVLRLRNIAEHSMTTTDGNVLTTARTTRANWLARAFLAPYWVNYHVEHHALMFVPCHKLRAVHDRLRDQPIEYKPGYRAVLRNAIA